MGRTMRAASGSEGEEHAGAGEDAAAAAKAGEHGPDVADDGREAAGGARPGVVRPEQGQQAGGDALERSRRRRRAASA